MIVDAMGGSSDGLARRRAAVPSLRYVPDDKLPLLDQAFCVAVISGGPLVSVHDPPASETNPARPQKFVGGHIMLFALF